MGIVIFFFKILLNIFYFFCKFLPVNKNKILFLSRQSNEINLDFKLLYKELSERHKDIKAVFICRRVEEGILSKLSFCGAILKSLPHLAVSKVCILDSYWPSVSVLKHKKSLTIIQIWHALGKIKQSGYQTLGKTSGRGEKIAKSLNMHKNYDLIIAGGKAWNPFYCQSFGVSEDILINVGLPRIDYLIDQEEKNREKILKKYPNFKGKTVILYAPTFRRGYDSDWHDLTEFIDYNRYILIVKGHPNEKIEEKNEKYFCCEEFSAVELLSVCDFLITDYSAIALEAAILNIKTYYYIYDYDRYRKNNGINIDIEKVMKGCTFRKAGDLIRAVEKEAYPVEMLKSYRENYLPDNPGNSTKSIVNIIESKLGQKNDETCKDSVDRKSVV